MAKLKRGVKKTAAVAKSLWDYRRRSRLPQQIVDRICKFWNSTADTFLNPPAPHQFWLFSKYSLMAPGMSIDEAVILWTYADDTGTIMLFREDIPHHHELAPSYSRLVPRSCRLLAKGGSRCLKKRSKG